MLAREPKLVMFLIIAFLMVQTGIRCVRPDGCFRTFCDYDRLEYEYQEYARKSALENSAVCREIPGDR